MPVSKEQILTKIQELDTALQTAVQARTELGSLLAELSADTFCPAIEIPLSFHDNGNIISWGNHHQRFSPSTFRLLLQLWFAPDRTLSKEEVCDEVIEDNCASNESIWTCIKRARQELKSAAFPYEIETLRGKGYRLAGVSTFRGCYSSCKDEAS